MLTSRHALHSPHPALLAFLPSHSRSSSTQSGGGLEADSRSSSRGSLEELSQYRHREASSVLSCGSMGGMKQKMLLDYNVYMAKYVIPQASSKSPTATDSPGQSPESSPKTVKKVWNRDAWRTEKERTTTQAKWGYSMFGSMVPLGYKSFWLIVHLSVKEGIHN